MFPKTNFSWTCKIGYLSLMIAMLFIFDVIWSTNKPSGSPAVPTIEDWKYYHNATSGLSFQYPPGWSVGEVTRNILTNSKGEDCKQGFTIVKPPWTIPSDLTMTYGMQISVPLVLSAEPDLSDEDLKLPLDIYETNFLVAGYSKDFQRTIVSNGSTRSSVTTSYSIYDTENTMLQLRGQKWLSDKYFRTSFDIPKDHLTEAVPVFLNILTTVKAEPRDLPYTYNSCFPIPIESLFDNH